MQEGRCTKVIQRLRGHSSKEKRTGILRLERHGNDGKEQGKGCAGLKKEEAVWFGEAWTSRDVPCHL